MTTDEKMLVLVSDAANSNKFYHLKLEADGTVHKRWGRVGTTGQTQVEHTGYAGFDKILRDKTRKGYRETKMLPTAPKANSLDKASIGAIAHKKLAAAASSEVTKLIDRIVAVNQHEILETSGGQITVDDGVIRTPLGIVSAAAIGEARQLLHRMQTTGVNAHVLEDYLSLVPQKIPSKRGWAQLFFTEHTTFEKQEQLLDQLEASISWYATAKTQAASTADADFRYQVQLVTDKTVLDKVSAYVDAGRDPMHKSRHLKLKRVYELVDPAGAAVFADKLAAIGNMKELWHGTRAYNVLSILRKGLFVPPFGGTKIHTTGRMFGDGVYLSEHSTKSLNYSYGYWSGGQDSNCFMFLADVALGQEYRPHQHGGWNRRTGEKAAKTGTRNGKPFNSIAVRAGTANLRNSEIVVWDTDQIRLRYLLEFDSK